jgi:hypothetical protein
MCRFGRGLEPRLKLIGPARGEGGAAKDSEHV